ncbi:polyphosphate kinase 1 [Butyricicoccus sp.]|uniref:polyphosphate kinase 1 n=1 Tax=Butyricicoccus sp. TaxID=2049021 RepID=UPI003AADF1DB
MHEMVYANRELSWLKFNERVLEEAARKDVPLAERLSFLSIYQSNLDEFFRVRVGTHVDQMHSDQEIRDNKTNMTSAEQIQCIFAAVHRLNTRKDEIFTELMMELEDAGVRVVDFHTIDEEESRHLEGFFDREVAPLLSPIVVDKRQPFPFLRNQEIYAAAVLKKPSKKKERVGIVACSSSALPRLVQVSECPKTYMLSEELILHFISKIFSNYEIKAKSLLRVSRNADIDADALYDEDLDYREFMSGLMKKRRRLAPIRLEMSRDLDKRIVKLLCKHLETEEYAVFKNNTPLDLSYLFMLQNTLRGNSTLFYPHRSPRQPASIQRQIPVLDQVRESDKLLSYPYESIKPFLTMLHEAATDPKVVSIKMTLYRVAKDSQVVEALCEAAENGKDVLVLVELKARFDEENNIEWSRRLEEAGCTVIYGLNGYKVHSKLCLITRMGESGQPEYYTQIGTGNYNEKTARLYTDYSVLTHDQEIGRNAAQVFQALAMGETLKKSGPLLVAPHCLQNRVLEMIDEQIALAKRGEEAYIGVKINSLTDKKIIDALMAASQAGVKIEMVVRGICCLIPGVPGKTENIRIVSIVGRFLEHSRIYIFGTGKQRKIYIASADFMTRNTLRRVEVAAPIRDEALQEEILSAFDVMLRDNCQAWNLCSDGVYRRNRNDQPKLNAQETFFQQAYDREQKAAAKK